MLYKREGEEDSSRPALAEGSPAEHKEQHRRRHGRTQDLSDSVQQREDGDGEDLGVKCCLGAGRKMLPAARRSYSAVLAVFVNS